MMSNDDRAFQWLTENGYPEAAMSQQKGFTTFYLSPILAKYAEYLKDQPTPVRQIKEK